MTPRSSSFRRWLRASTLAVVACAGSALLFHDSETSAWDTTNEDDQHDANSHDSISGWLRDKDNGGHRWHPIGTRKETCNQVLNESSDNQRNDDFPHKVDIPNNFRVQDCIDYYRCDSDGEVGYINSTWRENHRHSTTGTGDPGAHEYHYKKSLNGTEYSSSATLTCGGDDGDGDGTPDPTTFTLTVAAHFNPDLMKDADGRVPMNGVPVTVAHDTTQTMLDGCTETAGQQTARRAAPVTWEGLVNRPDGAGGTQCRYVVQLAQCPVSTHRFSRGVWHGGDTDARPVIVDRGDDGVELVDAHYDGPCVSDPGSSWCG